MAKRGRTRKTVDQIRASYREMVNGLQLQDGLKLLIDPASGRVAVYEETGEGDMTALIAGVSGNTFVDGCAIARVLASKAQANFFAEQAVEPVDLTEDSDQA